MATLDNGRVVHASRLDDKTSDVAKAIKKGEIKLINRWIKPEPKKKKTARRS